MALAEILQQAVPEYRHCYIRHRALLAQLNAEAGDEAGPGQPSLLQHLRAAYCDGGSGGAAATAAAVCLLAPGGGTTFERCFAQEVERLRLFLRSLLEQRWLELLEGCAQLRGLSEELLQGGQAHPRRLDALLAGFDAAAADVVAIERFVQHNVAACAQLAQMHDQQARWQGRRGGSVAAAEPAELAPERVHEAYVAAARAALLGDLSLEALLMGLSDAYELCRLVESDAAALAGRLGAKWVPPDKFERVTRKFWLRPEDVTRFKAAVIRHLPILLFGDRRKLTEGSPYRVSFLRDQRGASDSSLVSSVYYDDAALSTYHDRLRKEDGATAVRLRWYGERSPGPDQVVYVERKVHRERHTGERSYKERAPLAQRDVLEYTRGTGGLPEPAGGAGPRSQSQAELLASVQRFLAQRRQEPLLRTCCRRTAFQESSSNQVRISLDTQLRMVREAGAPRAPNDWDDSALPAGPADAARFPYAVVEIKLQAAAPGWVQGLLQTGMLLPVPKFSKFLHGAATLFQHRCRNVPYWFLPDEADALRMSAASWEEMADPADEYLRKGMSWLFPSQPGAEAEAEAASAAEPPYRPARLPFLHRNKTAPAGSDGGSSGCSEGRRTSGDAAAAGRGDGGGAAALWESAARVAGGLPRAPGPPLPQQQQPALLPRHVTWPVYQAPPLLPPPTGPLPGGRAALPAAPLPPGQPVDGAAAAARLARASPAHSQTSTPLDSAQDLEAGRGGEPGGGKAGGGKARATAGGTPPSMLAALQYRLLGRPHGAAAPRPDAPSPSARARALVRTRVEPKTFFANERTFLQWLQISVLIMMTATSLLSGTGLLSGVAAGGRSCTAASDTACYASKLSGAVIAPVALLFMAYALFMYKKRTYQILRRETVRYDDQRGPVVLVAILLVVFSLAYILAMVFIF